MKKIIIVVLFVLVLANLFSVNFATDEQKLDMYHLMTNLLFQLAIIVFVARGCGFLAEKIGFPGVIGELAAGILIGPYLLGSIPIWGFPKGVFPEHIGSNLPISPELYGFSTFGLVVLLFLAGLETDTKLLKRYTLAGFCIAISGLALSFYLGIKVSSYFFGYDFIHPVTLFYGLTASVTSVGITARILSERRSMDSPEGVTIHFTTVINDVLVVILLAIVMAITSKAVSTNNISISWNQVILISIKSFGILAITLFLGMLLSQKISSFFKLFKNKYLITFLAFGLALLISALFEKVGLAMIIGAYITGLFLSKTDISFSIQEHLHPLGRFFIPIFFAVMGMKVDIVTLLSWDYIKFGVLFSILAIASKVIGCGLTSLFFNFNKLGALRIGFGMAPRGEVALIIAGIGLSSGYLPGNSFGILILMIILTTIISPQILNSFLKIKKIGVKKQYKISGITMIEYKLPDKEEVEFLVSYITKFFHSEGFWINKRILDEVIYEIRKNNVFIKLFLHDEKIIFKTSDEDISFVKAVVYEAFLKLDNTMKKLKAISKPVDMRKELVFDNKKKYKINLSKIIDPNCVILNLKGNSKNAVIKELVNILYKNGRIDDKNAVLNEIMDREKSMSTAMTDGVAIPHTRTSHTNKTTIAIGLAREGIDFDSIDGKPTKIVACLISSNKDNDPHIQVLAAFSAFIATHEAKIKLLNCATQKEVWSFFLTQEQKDNLIYQYVYSSNNNNIMR